MESVNKIILMNGDKLLDELCNLTKKFQEKYDKLLNKFNHYYLEQLPFIELINDDFYTNNLLPSESCLYFLTHNKEGLLYIGKAKNLRSRWRIDKSNNGDYIKSHHMLRPVLDLKNVKLSWYKICSSLSLFIEHMLIKKLNPKWNTLK